MIYSFNYRPKVQDYEHSVFNWVQWMEEHVYKVIVINNLFINKASKISIYKCHVLWVYPYSIALRIAKITNGKGTNSAQV